MDQENTLRDTGACICDCKMCKSNNHICNLNYCPIQSQPTPHRAEQVSQWEEFSRRLTAILRRYLIEDQDGLMSEEIRALYQTAINQAVAENEDKWKAKVTNLLRPNESRKKCIATHSGTLSGGEMCPLCGFCPELAKKALLNPTD